MAARQEVRPFTGTLDANGSSDSLKVDQYADKVIVLSGTFSATVQPQASLDGTVWVSLGSPITGAGVPAVVETTPAWTYLKLVISSYVSGTVVAQFAGFNQRVAH